MKPITFKRFHELCQEADYVHVGDELVLDTDFHDENTIIFYFETSSSLRFSNTPDFKAEADAADVVHVIADDDDECEISFYTGVMIKPSITPRLKTEGLAQPIQLGSGSILRAD